MYSAFVVRAFIVLLIVSAGGASVIQTVDDAGVGRSGEGASANASAFKSLHQAENSIVSDSAVVDQYSELLNDRDNNRTVKLENDGFTTIENVTFPAVNAPKEEDETKLWESLIKYAKENTNKLKNFFGFSNNDNDSKNAKENTNELKNFFGFSNNDNDSKNAKENTNKLKNFFGFSNNDNDSRYENVDGAHDDGLDVAFNDDYTTNDYRETGMVNDEQNDEPDMGSSSRGLSDEDMWSKLTGGGESKAEDHDDYEHHYQAGVVDDAVERQELETLFDEDHPEENERQSLTPYDDEGERESSTASDESARPGDRENELEPVESDPTSRSPDTPTIERTTEVVLSRRGDTSPAPRPPTPAASQPNNKTRSDHQNDHPTFGAEDSAEEESGVTLAFVFDATGSMWDDLVQVREGAAKILNAMLERPDKPIYNYVLVPFQDPVIGPVTVTTDHAYLKQQLSELQVYGGTDCPEMSVGAVKLALETSLPYSYIYVFTDASAKDYALLDEVLPLIQEKLSTVVYVMTGDCGNSSHPGYLVYQTIAATSSGQVYHLNKTDVDQVLNFIRLSLQPQKEKVNLLSVDHVGNATNNDKQGLSLTVDNSLSEFTVSISGRNASLGVVDPYGSPAVPPRLTPLLDLENVKVVNIKEPDPGVWTLQVDSDSQYTLRSTGLSSSDFGYGFSIHPTTNPTQTVLRPLKGAETNLLVWATEPENLKSFNSVELTRLNGNLYELVSLHPITGIHGLYRANTFVPPDDLFYISVHGISNDGYPFRRITPTAVSPVNPVGPVVTAEPSIEIDASGKTLLTCHVKSLLPFDVDWYRNNIKLQQKQLYMQTASVTYELKNVSKSDEGSYICRASNKFGLAYRQIKVTIKGGVPIVRAWVQNGAGDVKAGNDVIFECAVSSDLPYSISWAKQKVDQGSSYNVFVTEEFLPWESSVQQRIGFLKNNSLYVMNIEKDDSGIYFCKAESAGGIGESHFSVSVFENPEIEISSDLNEVIEGGNITLMCRTIKGEPELSWMKDGEPVENYERRGIIETIDGRSVLKFSKVQKSDEGLYSCIARNKVGKDEARSMVYILERPEVIVENGKQVRVDGPTNVRLHCNVYKAPTYNLTWIQGRVTDERVLTDVFSYELDPEKFDRNDGYLEIKNVNKADEGWYTCIAQSKAGFGEGEVFLTVDEVPKLEVVPAEVQFRKGEVISLQCSLTAGSPVPNMMWYKDGRALAVGIWYAHVPVIIERHNDSTLKLKINQAQKSDAGKYECRAINNAGFGQAFSYAHLVEAPTVEIAETNKLVKEGDSVLLTCRVSGEPYPAVQWFKDEQELVHNSVLQPFIVLNNNSLQIPSIETNSAGLYTCRAENPFGRDEDFIELEVGTVPVINSISNNTGIDIESNGFLICDVVGYPKPKIVWVRKDLRPLDPNRFQITDHGELHITDIRKEDEGVCICIGENVFGTVSSEVEVKVTGIELPQLKKTREQEEKTFEIRKFVPGDKIEIPCTVSQGKPQPQRTWYYNGIPIQKFNYDHSPHLISESGTLVINSLLPNQTGLYECVATNLAGTDKIRVDLDLFRQPVILPDAPANVKGLEGQTVELPCTAVGDPLPVISWERPGYHQLPVGSLITNERTSDPESKENRIQSTGEVYGGLVFMNASGTDEGTYVCIAENVAGAARRAISIHLLVSPRIVTLTEDVTAIEGQIVELNCEAEGKPEPLVSWLKDNSQLKWHHGLNSKSLRFNSAATDDGIYTCVASNSVGTEMRNTTVNILVPPQIINNGEEMVQVVEGGKTKLQCKADGKPTPSISWQWNESKNDSVINEDDHYSVDGDELIIKNATIELPRVYICDAENSAGITQKVFHLEVLVLPHILEDFPLNVSLAEGDDYSMPCTASGHPTPIIFWQRGDAVLRPGHQHGNKFVMQDNTLVLTAVPLESSGKYSCIAYNAAGTASRNYTVDVLVAPVVIDSSETRVEVLDTMTGIVTCPVASADPPPTIVWLKNGTALDFRTNERADDVHFYMTDGGRSLKIVEARSSDNGVYTCVATNLAGTSQAKFTVDVIIPPYFINEFATTEITLKQGEPALLDCSVGGNPHPKMNWRRVERNLPVTEHTAPGVGMDKSKQKLKIESVEYHHGGKYHCSAVNKLGRLDRTFTLTVIGPPEVEGVAMEAVEIVAGDARNLTCTMSGFPQPEFSWIYTTPRNRNITLMINSNELVLKNISSSDAGLYTCRASNKAGKDYKAFNVSVLEPPTIEGSELRQEVRVRSSEFLRLSCVVRGRPQPSVTWLRNGLLTKPLSNNTTSKHLYTVMLPALAGKYSCVASNKVGVAEKVFIVKILIAPRWAQQRSHFSTDDVMNPVLGFPLTIKCPVTGNPPPEIFWLKDGSPLMEGKDAVYYPATEQSHSGNYTCFAINHAGNFSKSFMVDILVPPTFLDGEEAKDIKLMTNATAVFNCSVKGNPQPQVLWLRGLIPLPSLNESQQIMEIHHVTAGDSDDYSCLASNSAGDAEKSFSLQVLEPPAMDEGSSVSVSNLSVKLHRRVAIKCPLSGTPAPNITWFKNGKEIHRTDTDKAIEISSDGRQLQIIHAVADDAGNYHCVAQNQAGNKELIFELSVVVPLEWSEWAEWEECSMSCGGGEQRRARHCGGSSTPESQPSSQLIVLDKSNCLGDEGQTRKCNIVPCQMEDGWTEWTSWSECSATCGESTRRRSRTCETQRPAVAGMPCIGSSSEYQTCDVPQCSYWGTWSEWSECSASCNYGTRFRMRRCMDPIGNCEGTDREVVACNTHRCPVNGRWSTWGEWSSCSVSCGRGTRQRSRICHRPRFGGKPCGGDNLQIEKCRIIGCNINNYSPKLANLRVRGTLNGERFPATNLSAQVSNYRGKRVVTATVSDILKQQAGWFPYLTFLMPPVSWNTAYEEGSTDNGYSLTNGNFDEESRFQFATGHELVVDAKGRGIDPDDGALQVEIEVIGEIPMAQPRATVLVEPFTEDYVQTGPNKLYASSESAVDVDGEVIPFTWNKTVSYDTELGTMPYPVERLSTEDITADYDPATQELRYSAATVISSPYGREKCPKGFKLDRRYQHCRDIDECKSNKNNDCHHTQICENLFGTYKCLCPDGYKSIGHGKRCQDVNECEDGVHECTHLCVNTNGSYRCTCPPGMAIQLDSVSCKDETSNNGSEEEGFAADWGSESYYKQAGNHYYDDNDYNAENDYSLALEQQKEEWTCPPGQIKDGNKCTSTRDKTHCGPDKCNDYETCLPTVHGHRCVETRCPLHYHHDTRSRKCIQLCAENVCFNGATEVEEISFVPLPLEITSVQRYQDLLELLDQDATVSTVYTIVENESNLPLRVRIEKGAGVLYSMKYFDVEGVSKVIVRATTYDEDNSTTLSVYTFIIFIYDPSAL